MEAFQKELANLDNVLMETISVDNRILEQLQTFVRQGYTNPFQVRAGLKVSFLFFMFLKRCLHKFSYQAKLTDFLKLHY